LSFVSDEGASTTTAKEGFILYTSNHQSGGSVISKEVLIASNVKEGEEVLASFWRLLLGDRCIPFTADTDSTMAVIRGRYGFGSWKKERSRGREGMIRG
jgi:hypothetical protein